MKHTVMTEPARIAKLPHYKDLPITATTLVNEAGIPDFRAINNAKIWQFKKERKCSICGDPLDYWIAFMVSEGEAQSRYIYESPNHEECLEYAFQICPWLFYSKRKYSSPERMKQEGYFGSHPDRAVTNERPELLGIYVCRSYENVIHKGIRVCKVPKAKRIEWIKGQ
jgi:hypothetical protein